MEGCSWVISNYYPNIFRNARPSALRQVTLVWRSHGRHELHGVHGTSRSAWDVTNCTVYDKHNNTWLVPYQYSYQHGELHISTRYRSCWYEALHADTRTDMKQAMYYYKLIGDARLHNVRARSKREGEKMFDIRLYYIWDAGCALFLLICRSKW